jgi:hypothetical protein
MVEKSTSLPQAERPALAGYTEPRTLQQQALKGVLSHLLPKKIRLRHIELATRLYEYIPPVCWLTEAHLAEALGTTTRQIKIAKAYLEHIGKVRVELRPNGRRANPVHTLIKTSPINHYVRGGRSARGVESIDWTLFNNLGAKNLNEMGVHELLDFYEELGLQVIPLHYPKFKGGLVYCSCKNGRACPWIGKHPVVSYQSLDFFDRRTYRTIKGYWRADVNYNVGFKVDGFAVVDVDYRKDGQYRLAYLEDELGEIPATLSVKTGNGRHVYVKANDLPNSTDVMGLVGVDVRSSGGIVVAPCSIHASNNQYKWESIGEPETLPDDWATFLRGGSGTTAKGKKQGAAGAQPQVLLPTAWDTNYVIPEGQRNWTLFLLACRERGKGADYETILDAITKLNEAHCEPKLRTSELRTIARSAMRYPSEAEKLQGLEGRFKGG